MGRVFSDIYLLSPLNLKVLFEISDLKPLFLQRQQPRIQYKNGVLVYNENSFYKGATWSLSSEGIGVILQNKTPFEVGTELQVHIDRHAKHDAIHTKCNVVSRRQVGGQEHLDLKFVTPDGRIRDLVKKELHG